MLPDLAAFGISGGRTTNRTWYVGKSFYLKNILFQYFEVYTVFFIILERMGTSSSFFFDVKLQQYNCGCRDTELSVRKIIFCF